MDPVTAAAIISGGGDILKSLGGYFGGGTARKVQKESYGMLPGLESGLKKGIGMADINQLLPLLRRGLQPYLNRVAGGASAKFGASSGATLGAINNASIQGLSPQLANLWQMALQNNQQNLRSIYGQRASLANPG